MPTWKRYDVLGGPTVWRHVYVINEDTTHVCTTHDKHTRIHTTIHTQVLGKDTAPMFGPETTVSAQQWMEDVDETVCVVVVGVCVHECVCVCS